MVPQAAPKQTKEQVQGMTRSRSQREDGKLEGSVGEVWGAKLRASPHSSLKPVEFLLCLNCKTDDHNDSKYLGKKEVIAGTYRDQKRKEKNVRVKLLK